MPTQQIAPRHLMEDKMTTDLAWSEPHSSGSSLPWRKLSSRELTLRTLQVFNPINNEWRNTKLMVVVDSQCQQDQKLVGKLLYIIRPEVVKETRFHCTYFDALVRGAVNIDASVRARSAELSGDATALQQYCDTLGVNWYGIKNNVGARMAIASILADMSQRYLPAIRERLQYVSKKAAKTANLQDRLGRDNPSAMRAQWQSAYSRLCQQYLFNEKSAASTVDMVLLAWAIQNYVDGLIGQLLAVNPQQPARMASVMRKLEQFVIFKSPSYATTFMLELRRGKKLDRHLATTIAAVFAAEQQMCAASNLVSLIRDLEAFRTREVLTKLRNTLTWEKTNTHYDSISSQLLVFTDILETSIGIKNEKKIRKAAKSIKSLIRMRL